MGFNFRYKALLSYREHLKGKAEIDLSQAHLILNAHNKELDDYKIDLLTANQELEIDLKKKISSHVLKNHSEFTAALEIKIEKKKLEIFKAEQVVEEKRETLLARTKDYKIIEKLEEKDQKKWNHQQHLTEQKEMSETAIIRFEKDFL